MMKAIAVAQKGFEDISALEIKELIGKDSEIRKGCIIFECSEEELCIICYKAQSISRAGALLKEFKFSEMEDLEKNIDVEDIGTWIKTDKTFSVRCHKDDNDDFSSPDIAKEAGAVIITKMPSPPKVDFKDPHVPVMLYINKQDTYLFIDFAGFDLSKREYKIFTHAMDIKGTLAYCLLRYAGYNKDNLLLDAFSHSGTVTIEAAFFSSNFPVNHFRKDAFAFNKFFEFDFDAHEKKSKFVKKIHGFDSQLRNISAAKKNAKIAGVDKAINYSRVDTEWLDTKFSREQVDIIVSAAPMTNKHTDPKIITKIYKELFHHVEFILKPGGTMVLYTNASDIIKENCEEFKLLVKDEKIIELGDSRFSAIKLQKP